MAVGAIVALGLCGVAGASALLIAGGGADRRDAGHGASTPRAERGERVLARLAAARRGGPGRVRLRVSAEAVPGVERRPGSVPAGVPATLSFELPGHEAPGDRRPRLLAHRLATPRAATAGGEHRPRRRSGGSSSGRPIQRVALDRSDTFLANRASGEVVVPTGLTAGAGHAHGEQPGRGLAQTIQGGGFAWATKVARGAADVRVDAGGRWLVAAHPAAGSLEVVDLLRRERAGTVRTGGRPGAMSVQPGSSRVWAADGRGIVVVDVAARRVVGRVGAGAGRLAVAFDAGGRRALVTSAAAGTATLVDTLRLRPLARVRVGKGAVDVAYAAGARAFAVARGDGALVPVRVGGVPALRPGRPIFVGDRNSGTDGVRVAPDGRTAVAVNGAAGELAVVDMRAARVLRIVDAGAQPRELVFLGRFAIARDARSATLTWVDTARPERSNDLTLGRAPAAALSLSADGTELLATAPEDQAVFRIHTMMGRPMVMGRLPNSIGADAVVASRGGIHATGARVLEQRTVFEHPGRYRLELRLGDGSRAEFELSVSQATSGPRVRPDAPRLRATAGNPVTVRFRVAGPAPAHAELLAYATGDIGVPQLRVPARRLTGGRFEAEIVPPATGTYRLNLVAEKPRIAPTAEDSTLLRVAPD